MVKHHQVCLKFEFLWLSCMIMLHADAGAGTCGDLLHLVEHTRCISAEHRQCFSSRPCCCAKTSSAATQQGRREGAVPAATVLHPCVLSVHAADGCSAACSGWLSQRGSTDVCNRPSLLSWGHLSTLFSASTILQGHVVFTHHD
jgi:hypothetical protein